MKTGVFTIQQRATTDDGIGGKTTTWAHWATVRGYLDLVTGSDENPQQNAFLERSTHVLIIPVFTDGITDKMRVVDSAGRWYHVTYSDDPVGQGHHNEVYLTYGGAT